ncbi:MAG: JAB domain-containing protein [Culicoidibacterales bacterium]
MVRNSSCSFGIRGISIFSNKIKINEVGKMSAKRVNIVSTKLVRESSLLYQERRIKKPSDAEKLMRMIIGGLDREVFAVVMLNTKNEPIAIERVAVGTLNSAMIHPREVFKAAILSTAASIIIGHNHPSGDATPSSDDIKTTKRLIEVGELVGIEVLDHIIIGEHGFCSMKESGCL